MKKKKQRFTASIPVKPYVRRFLEMNYGMPSDFSSAPEVHHFFQNLLRKPDSTYDKKYPDIIRNYSLEAEVYISEHDFYRYGWELTRTNVVAFGKYFEHQAKLFMRISVGSYRGMGLPFKTSIRRFQERFDFDEDTWNYETIKKDFYRSGHRELIDFDGEIFGKIERIILQNLYGLGTISKKGVKAYEEDK